jgi:hypothetical protein
VQVQSTGAEKPSADPPQKEALLPVARTKFVKTCISAPGMAASKDVLAVLLQCWAEAPIKIARMTLTIKLDGNWSSFQLANSAPPLSVTDSAIAPSARIDTLEDNLVCISISIPWQ